MFKLKEFYQYKREIQKRNKVLRVKLLTEIPKITPKLWRNFNSNDYSPNLGQGIIYLKASQNNTIITLTNLKGQVQAVRSCGCLGFNGKKKRSTKFAIESSLLSIIQKAKESGWEKVGIYMNGFAKGRFYVLNCLKKVS